VYAPILPLAIVQVTMRERWPGLQTLVDDWANFAYYSIYLIAGFAFARFPALEESMHRERKRALAVALAATAVLLLGVLGAFSSPEILLVHTAIAGWCFVVSLLGWARHKLSFRTATLAYLTESAFPVYLLHQAAIVVPGYFLIRSPLGLWTKFLLLLAVSSALTMAIYHLLVRPFPFSRFLCGMKTTRTAVRARSAARLARAGLALAVVVAAGIALSNRASANSVASPLGLRYAEQGAAQAGIPGAATRPAARLPDWSVAIQAAAGSSEIRCAIHSEVEDRLRLRGGIAVPCIWSPTAWVRIGGEAQTCRDSIVSGAPAPDGRDRS
jgi:hypothetical protein